MRKVLSVSIVLGIIFILSFLTIILNPSSIRDYSLTKADINVHLKQGGDIDIKESISYTFEGCFSEVFREINIPRDKLPNHPYISELNAECSPECKVYDREYEIAGNFNRICDRDAEFFINFTVLNGVVIGKDVAEFHYKIWGEEWEKPLQKLNGKITLPENINTDNVMVYFNPEGIVKEYKFEKNSIIFEAKSLNSYLEVRLLMPKDSFIGDNFIFNEDLEKQNVIQIQEFYIIKYNILLTFLVPLFLGIILFLILFPVKLYKRYGKEPKIDYKAIYEREPIKGIKPYVINSLCVGKLGNVDTNAITATLLDLVRRKHIELEDISKKRKLFFGTKKDLLFKFKQNSKDKLSEPEKKIYSFFEKHSKNKELLWSELLKKLRKQNIASDYLKMIQAFEKSVDKSYELNKYFESKGNKILKIVSAATLALGFLLLIITLIFNNSNYPMLSTYSFAFVLLIMFSIIGLALPSRIFGRFTPEGLEIYLKSRNFKKFMTDMTLLKKYPPKSVIIWDEILVYATLFGVADKVLKQMKIVANDKKIKSSNFYPLYATNTLYLLNKSYSVAATSSSRSSYSGAGGFSGGGGIGGGFGGGGGGAR
jgi:uncharacterized membrane protein